LIEDGGLKQRSAGKGISGRDPSNDRERTLYSHHRKRIWNFLRDCQPLGACMKLICRIYDPVPDSEHSWARVRRAFACEDDPNSERHFHLFEENPGWFSLSVTERTYFPN